MSTHNTRLTALYIKWLQVHEQLRLMPPDTPQPVAYQWLSVLDDIEAELLAMGGRRSR